MSTEIQNETGTVSDLEDVVMVALRDNVSNSPHDLPFKRGENLSIMEKRSRCYSWRARSVNSDAVGEVPLCLLAPNEEESSQWYHSDISSQSAYMLLMSSSVPVGSFLVRITENDQSRYTLSVKAIKHKSCMSIQYTVNDYSICHAGKNKGYTCNKDPETTLPDLTSLLLHYKLQCQPNERLTQSVSPHIRKNDPDCIWKYADQFAITTQDFVAMTTHDLQFKAGDRLQILERRKYSQWCKARSVSGDEGEVLTQYLAPDELSSCDWYHSELSFHQTVELLMMSSMAKGSFLIRSSEKHQNCVVLAVRTPKRVVQLKIPYDDGFYIVSPTLMFKSISLMIEYFTRHKLKLMCKLTSPVPMRFPTTLKTTLGRGVDE